MSFFNTLFSAAAQSLARRRIVRGDSLCSRCTHRKKRKDFLKPHRFFEYPLCEDLPWGEMWVRKLLGEIPKKMHWNYFRFTVER